MSPELQKLKNFCDQAEKLTLTAKNEQSITEKRTAELVTKTDIDVSQLATQFFNTNNLLDEEHLQKHPIPVEQRQAFLQKPELWVVDDIDGTAAHASRQSANPLAGLNFWGTTAGLWNYGKPIVGINALPSYIGERPDGTFFKGLILLAENDKCYIQMGENAPITEWKLPDTSNNHFITLASQTHSRYVVDFEDKTRTDKRFFPIDTHSCIYQFSNVFLGKTAASVFTGKPWDAAGSLAIAQSLGLELRKIKTGELFQGFHIEPMKNTWELEDLYILSRPQNYAIIRSALKAI